MNHKFLSALADLSLSGSVPVEAGPHAGEEIGGVEGKEAGESVVHACCFLAGPWVTVVLPWRSHFLLGSHSCS